MTTLNITVTGFTVDLAGTITITLEDTANTYLDETHPKRKISYVPENLTTETLNTFIQLLTDDSVDFFTNEANKIANQSAITTAFGAITIPNPIFNGDPTNYVYTQKVGK